MRKKSVLGGLALLSVLFIAAAPSDRVVSDKAAAGAGSLSLTIYSGNLALVREIVARQVGPGVHTIRVDGLPSSLDPASLVVLNAGVTLLGTHGLRSYQGAVGTGSSLDIDLAVERRVERLQLAFLTSGLDWKADYAMIIARDDATARVDGYATITNGSGAGYTDAEVQLLAGAVARGERGGFELDALRAARAKRERADVPTLSEAAFSDYHLYTLSDPVSLQAGETRRIRLLGAEGVEVEKQYVLGQAVSYRRSYTEPLTPPVAVGYRVSRPDGSELGRTPLPAGRIRVFQSDDAGRVQLLGIATIANSAKGEDLWLGTGYAFEIVGRRTQMEYRRLEGGAHESMWKVELQNETDTDVTVQVIERLSGDWRIIESTHDPEKLSASTVRFAVDVPAGGESVLTYRVRVRT